MAYEPGTVASAAARAGAPSMAAIAGAGNSPSLSLPAFADDLSFLEQHGPVIVLENQEHGVVVVSAKYQARVMTSAVSRDAASHGYINREFIVAGKTGTGFDNYGGEERFWLGPEAGRFGLYVPFGEQAKQRGWHEPGAIQNGDWRLTEPSPTEVTLTKQMKVENNQGTRFEFEIQRKIRILTEREILGRLKPLAGLGSIQAVGYESVNQITNLGHKPWTKAEGLLSIWLVSMYRPAADAYTLIPFDRTAKGDVVNDRYYVGLPIERLRVDAALGVISFLCDGLWRSKIGVSPARSKGWIASYRASASLLTLTNYEPPTGTPAYVNTLWDEQTELFRGDALNSYNDGPSDRTSTEPHAFYELETSSPAAALAPRQSLTHVQRTLHFVGPRSELDPVAQVSIGATLTEIGQSRSSGVGK